jgi:hypothetical protein
MKPVFKPSKIVKTISINKKYKFELEIYLALEDKLSWEIFPHDYNAALYAFSNKDKLNKTIESKHIYEPKQTNI